MARIIADGEVRLHWVPGAAGITDPAAPTVAELATGQDVTPFFSSFDTPLDGEATPAADLSSAFNKTVAGTFGGNVAVDSYRESVTDTAWGLWPRLTEGFFVIRRFGGSDVAIVATDEVEVYKIRVVTRSPATLDRGSVQMFNISAAVQEEPELEAVVAA
jgi:hypothetical protein